MLKFSSIVLPLAGLLVFCVTTIGTRSYASADDLSQSSEQHQQFINVTGSSLGAKLEEAMKMARSNSAKTPFWSAYSFDVRPGVALDMDYDNYDRTVNHFSGTTVSTGGSSGTRFETRNLGIFLLRSRESEQVMRLEVYNLDRLHEFGQYPVYWLGRAANNESMKLLQALVNANQKNEIVDRSVMAIGIHDDPGAGAILKDFVRNASSPDKVRQTAVFWLGQVDGETAFLADIVRREDENLALRKQAAFALGVDKDKDALVTLQNLYNSISNREVKRQIIFAASINQSKDDAVNFLIKVAQTDPDREERKQALFWLGQKAGQRSLTALKETVESSNTETEVQKQAVFAISQRPRDEAVPLLINIAKTHTNPSVRKQAMFWLGQTGDERALDFFKEILSK